MSDLPSTTSKTSWIQNIQDGLCIASQQMTSDFQGIYRSLTQSGQQEWELINRSIRSVQPTIEGGQSYTEVTLDWRPANYFFKKEADNPTIMASEFDLLYTDVPSRSVSEMESQQDGTTKRVVLHFEGEPSTSTNIEGILSYNPPLIDVSMARPRVVRRGNL